VNLKMIKKILIVNRGEIAVRIIRTCREMGIRTVAVFSEVDRTSMHVRMADEAFSLVGKTSAETYLRQDRIIEIAKRSRADAIHPGYGFLSENPEFAEQVEAAGLTFIGPPARAIRALGDKMSARKTAEQLGIPTVPGTRESIADDREAETMATKIGYPILLKPAAGGGGKGMRVVESEEELADALRAAKSEAKNSFGDERIYIEKYIERPRHVEIQILADSHNNTVHLGERECSIQRRHQKVIEEAPSPIIDEKMRIAMGNAAVRLAQYVGYTNAGTVEFLVDEHKRFYFLEVNTRLQVEHPVTEMVTGIDLVRQQILIADGHRLSFTQDEINTRGHAIECRICAEDPEDQFFPSTGTLTSYTPPQGPRVRVDNGLTEGNSVSIYYDPMMAKVITWGQDRVEAIESMKRALAEFNIQGIKSTIPFCLFVLNNASFQNGEFDTKFVETYFDPEKLNTLSTRQEIAAVVAAVLLQSGAQHQHMVSKNHPKREQSPWKRNRLESYR
jgi:acetyl-CoA carboxylase biotin carboxylase subunit